MDEMREYLILRFRQRRAKYKDFLKKTNKEAASKNIFIQGVWFLAKYLFVKPAILTGICRDWVILWISLGCEYMGVQLRDVTFDVHYMEYHIQTTGMTVDEALTFLNEQIIKLKKNAHLNNITEKDCVSAIKSLDYLVAKYNALKENIINNSEKVQKQWIETLWQTLREKKCVTDDDKRDFKLIMDNNQPLKKVMWCKALKWLVQFVREGIETKKIEVQGKADEDRFIIDYIMQNFFPSPRIPHQKAKHYTEKSIKREATKNRKDRIKGRMYFVFEQTTTFAAKY